MIFKTTPTFLVIYLEILLFLSNKLPLPYIFHFKVLREKFLGSMQHVEIICSKQNIINIQDQNYKHTLTGLHVYKLVDDVFFKIKRSNGIIKLKVPLTESLFKSVIWFLKFTYHVFLFLNWRSLGWSIKLSPLNSHTERYFSHPFHVTLNHNEHSWAIKAIMILKEVFLETEESSICNQCHLSQ